MSKFQSVVESEQQNVGPQQKLPLAENENSASKSNQEQGLDNSNNIWKRVEGYPIAIVVGARADAWSKDPTEKVVIHIGKKVYWPPLPSTYKKRKLSEDCNNGMKWVFRYYERYLK